MVTVNVFAILGYGKCQRATYRTRHAFVRMLVLGVSHVTPVPYPGGVPGRRKRRARPVMVTARLTAPRWALFAQVSTSAAGMVIRPNHHRRARASAGNLPGAGKRPACATAGALLPWAHDGLRTVLTARVLIAAVRGAVRAGQCGPGWCRCLRSCLPSAPRVLDVRLTAKRGQHLGVAQRVALPVALDPADDPVWHQPTGRAGGGTLREGLQAHLAHGVLGLGPGEALAVRRGELVEQLGAAEP